jgi:hypothetical protein
MTQGDEDPAVRARITADEADICGFGEFVYD